MPQASAKIEMSITPEGVAEFLFSYAARYREIYERATAAPPIGPGYPLLPISPFLLGSRFEVFIAKDGIVINEFGSEPDHQWYVAGGPDVPPLSVAVRSRVRVGW